MDTEEDANASFWGSRISKHKQDYQKGEAGRKPEPLKQVNWSLSKSDEYLPLARPDYDVDKAIAGNMKYVEEIGGMSCVRAYPSDNGQCTYKELAVSASGDAFESPKQDARTVTVQKKCQTSQYNYGPHSSSGKRQKPDSD